MKGINMVIGAMLILLATISASLILTASFGSQLHELSFRFFPEVEKPKHLVKLEILNAKILDLYSEILVKNVSNYTYDGSSTVVIKCEDVEIYSKVVDLNIFPGKTHIITLNDFNREIAMNKCKSNLFITISGNNLTSNSYFYGDVGIKIPISMYLITSGKSNNIMLKYENYGNLDLSNVNVKVYDYNNKNVIYDKDLTLNRGSTSKSIGETAQNYHLYIIYLNGIDINECYYDGSFHCYK